jgi:hypothetical protein
MAQNMVLTNVPQFWDPEIPIEYSEKQKNWTGTAPIGQLEAY